MALEKQTVSLALTKGMDTKSDSKQQVPGSLILLENARFTEPGKIKKRPGFDALGQNVLNTSQKISQGRGLTSFQDELVMSDGDQLYSYVDGLNEWKNKKSLFNINVETTTVVKTAYDQTSQDSCYHPAGLQAFVWEDTQGGCRYSVVDYATKTQLISNQLLSIDGTKPKAFALGNYLVLTYYDISEADIQALVLPVASLSSAFTVDLAIDPANDVYDATVFGSRLFFVYNNTSGNISLRYLNTNLSVSAAKTITAAVMVSTTICNNENNDVFIAYMNGTDLLTAKTDYNLIQNLTPVTITSTGTPKNITATAEADQIFIYWDAIVSPFTSSVISTAKYNYTTTTLVINNFQFSLGLASKAFRKDGRNYLLGVFQSQYQSSYFLIREEPQEITGEVVAKISWLTSGGLPPKNVLPQVNKIENEVYQFAILQKTTANSVNGLIVSQRSVSQTTINFSTVGLIATELSNNLLIAGGFLAQYDGNEVVEHGFHLWPDWITLTQVVGGTMVHGTYQYVAVYEWIDLQGNLHRSAPSLPVSITLGGAHNSVDITVPTLRVTAKENVVIQIYRTTNGGSIFYRVTSITAPIVNNTGPTVAFLDTQPDSSIIGNNQLYTTGGVVENIAAPASQVFTSFKNRIFLVPSENPNTFWYSKEIAPNTPVEFSDIFVNSIDEFAGPIRAMGVLDDKVIFFKENTKFYIYGDGPGPNGAGGAFSFSERITSDTGCVNQRSIVSTPAGLFYQSPKGIYNLQRSLVDEYIGAPVEQYTKNAQVTSAVLISNANQVRMTLNSGVTLVYDYFIGQWSIDTGLGAQDSTLFQGNKYALVRSNGQVLCENSAIFTDATRPIFMKLRTGWISFAQVQGFQRVYKMLLLGEYVSPHRLIVSIAENFNDNAHQQTYINASTLQNSNYGDDLVYGDSVVYGGEFPSYNFRVYMARQKSTSLQITLAETQTSNFGEGFSLSNIAFEVGIKRGLNKLKAGASYG